MAADAPPDDTARLSACDIIAAGSKCSASPCRLSTSLLRGLTFSAFIVVGVLIGTRGLVAARVLDALDYIFVLLARICRPVDTIRALESILDLLQRPITNGPLKGL